MTNKGILKMFLIANFVLFLNITDILIIQTQYLPHKFKISLLGYLTSEFRIKMNLKSNSNYKRNQYRNYGNRQWKDKMHLLPQLREKEMNLNEKYNNRYKYKLCKY